jgi:hypothetical protein
MPIERERLRLWVYDALAGPKQRLGIPDHQAVHLTNIAGWVKQRAQQENLLPPDTPFAQSNLGKADEDAIRECVWSLVIQGIVVPGSSNDSSHQANLPWLQVTEWGKTCLEKGEYAPYDAGLFLARIRNQVPHLDPIVDLYLKEALNSFRSGNYLAVAVMTGVASERVLIVLRDAIHSAIPGGDRKKKLMEATENQTAKRIYEAISDRIDPIREQLPEELQESIGTQLDGIFQEIRRTRNDAGHPTGRVIERDEAYALLQLFPVYAKSAYALIDWLKANQI